MPSKSSGGERLRSAITQRFVSAGRHTWLLEDGSLYIKRPCCGAEGTIRRPSKEARVPHKSGCPLKTKGRVPWK